MQTRRVGLWLIGACGGVGSTAALGLAALRRGLTDTTSLVTALPQLAPLDLDDYASFVVGGHEVRDAGFRQTVAELRARSNVFDPAVVQACQPDLQAWEANVRPGTVLHAGPTIAGLVERPEARRAETARAAVEQVQADLRAFREQHRLDQAVVVNVASTEPPFEVGEVHEAPERLAAALDRRQAVLPASALYAWAALDLGLPYVNFTPSLGASVPALVALAQQRRAPVAGKDAKTGGTLLKTVLAPMFA